MQSKIKNITANQDIYQFVAEDSTGELACYFIKIPSNKKILLDGTLSRANDDTMVDFKKFGEIVASCYGNKPSEQVKNYLLEHYNYSVED